MVYGESNGLVTDDVTWHSKVKALIPICLGPNIPIYFKWNTSKFWPE